MNYFKLLIISLLLFSCSTTTAPPTNEEVKDKILLWYAQENQKDGGGNWDVNGITVISIMEDEQTKGLFHTLNAVSGDYQPAPIPVTPAKRVFADTIAMDLTWNGAKWITAEEKSAN